MSKAGGQSVIHRKALVARDEFDAREMSPAKALRLSLARAGEALYGLALRVRTIEQEVIEHSAVEEAVKDDGLLILLDGTEGGRGAIKLDLQFLAGLIEIQLMGKVRRVEAAPRAFTQTDAAIAEPLMNALLDGTDADLTEANLPEIAPGLRFGDRVEDGRTLALALGAPDYDLYRLTVDMDGGAKTGVLTLLIPQRPVPKTAADGPDGRSLQAKLEENALNAPVMLDAVLGRIRLPLHKICDWKPGTMLPLAVDALTTARLIGAKGHQVARVKLGQLNGFRAVRLLLETGAAETSPEEMDQSVQQQAGGDKLPQVAGQIRIASDDEDSESWARVAGGAALQVSPPDGDPSEIGDLSAWEDDARADNGRAMRRDSPGMSGDDDL